MKAIHEESEADQTYWIRKHSEVVYCISVMDECMLNVTPEEEEAYAIKCRDKFMSLSRDEQLKRVHGFREYGTL